MAEFDGLTPELLLGSSFEELANQFLPTPAQGSVPGTAKLKPAEAAALQMQQRMAEEQRQRQLQQLRAAQFRAQGQDAMRRDQARELMDTLMGPLSVDLSGAARGGPLPKGFNILPSGPGGNVPLLTNLGGDGNPMPTDAPAPMDKRQALQQLEYKGLFDPRSLVPQAQGGILEQALDTMGIGPGFARARRAEEAQLRQAALQHELLTRREETASKRAEMSQAAAAKRSETAAERAAQRAEVASQRQLTRDVLKERVRPVDPKQMENAQTVLSNAMAAGLKDEDLKSLAASLGFSIEGVAPDRFEDLFGLRPKPSRLILRPVGNVIQQSLMGASGIPDALKEVLGLAGAPATPAAPRATQAPAERKFKVTKVQ